MNFGSFIRNKRKIKGYTVRVLANLLEISPSYLSSIESSSRPAPSKKVLDKMVETLSLNQNDIELLYDLASKSRKEIPQDLAEYINEHPSIMEVIRLSKKSGMGDDEWDRMKRIIFGSSE